MGEDSERAGGKKSGKSNTSEGLVKSKVVEDILETVNRENLGFSEQQLRPALDALIDYALFSNFKLRVIIDFAFALQLQITVYYISSPTYGTDDAYKWITKDNFAVLVNYIFECPQMTSDGSSSPLCSGKYAHRRHHNDQIPVKHYGNATESGLAPLVRFVADQGHFHSTPLRSNDSLKKHCRGEYSSSDSTKAKKMKFYSDCPGSRPTEHIKKSPLEQTGPVSRFTAARGETNVSSRTNKLHLDTFPSAPSSGRKEHYIPKQATQAGKQHGSVGPFNDNTSTDTGTSNASFKKNDSVDFKSSVVPRVKEKESSIHRSIHEEYASGKQVHSNHMCEKQLSATNTACVDEGRMLGSTKARNYYDRKIGELEMDTKECRKGKVRYYNEPQKDYKRNFSSKQISLTEELNMTSKGHCMKKVKGHNESVLSVTERVSVKQKSGNSEGDSVKRAIPIKHLEQNNSINTKKFYEEKKSRSRDNRKPSNDKKSMPSKEFTSPLKKQHSGKFEDSNREVLLPCRKINNVVQYHCSDKPNKKNAVIPEMLPLEEPRDMQDHLTVQDSFHGSKELTEEKKKPDLSKKKALSISNNNEKDNCLHGQGTPRSGEDAQAGRKKDTALSENADVACNLLSWDISRGLEKKKISCVNEYDDIFFPDDFVYITKSLITADAHVEQTLSRIGDMHCSCSGDCLVSTMPCKCTDGTRGEYGYDRDGLLIPRLANNFCFEDGKMTQARDFITECTPICPCDMQCGNRIVQRGLKYRLQVFMTKEGKGWGVRTLEKIMARSFLFEYIGEIMTNMEQYYRNEEYKDKNIHTYQMLLDADHDMETKHFKDGLNDNEALTLDATRYGNISRFVNHRCGDPNMFIRPVQIETRDTHYYHVAFFAAQDMSEMEELTWDYGINFQDKHEVKGFRCLCGSNLCRDSKRKVTKRG